MFLLRLFLKKKRVYTIAHRRQLIFYKEAAAVRESRDLFVKQISSLGCAFAKG